MDEAILIEIAQRFRKLEDSVESTDSYLAAEMDRLEKRMESADEERKRGGNYNEFNRKYGAAEERKDSISVARGDVEKALEACREDMVTMQEAIRGRH